MKLADLNIGVAMTGSFCTFASVITQIENVVAAGANVTPIFSYHAQSIDTRFGKAVDFLVQMELLTGNKPVLTIEDAEPLGPKKMLDILIIAPCTGNTLAKLSQGITDTPVLMAAKGHLRNQNPLVISLASNDALGMNFKNIGSLLNTKNIYFVPFYQDDHLKKPNSMLADTALIIDTLKAAMEHRQLQPILISKK